MKAMKKITSLLIVLLMLLSMAACGGNNGGTVNNPENPDEIVENTTTLNIMILHKGYGFKWLEALKGGFEKANPGVTVNLTTISKADIIKSDLKNYKKSDFDLYFDISNTGMASLVQEYSTYYGGNQALRPLNDVLNAEIPGEGITVKEKMYDSVLIGYQHTGRDTADAADDVYYGLPYVTGAMGLYYNETVINEALGEGNWEVPNTTDELIALCEKLKAAGCHILLPGSLDQYAKSFFLVNWTQYEGIENYLKFFDGIGFDSARGRETTKSSLIYQQKGRLESMKVAFDLLDPDNGFVLSNTAEIGVNNLNDYQKRFMNSKNKLAFYFCGDWLMQEIQDNSGTGSTASVVKMMKTPVISSIIDSTNGYSVDNEVRLPNVNDDATLSAVIDYVDGISDTLPAGVTDSEAEFIRSARNTMGSNNDIHSVYAPAFSNAKTLANKFLIYMASDEGIQIFKDNCIGGFAPYQYTYEGLSVTEQSIYDATKNGTFVCDFKYNELFYFAGAKAINLGISGTFDSYITSPVGQFANAEALHQQFVDDNSGIKWDTLIGRISG